MLKRNGYVKHGKKCGASWCNSFDFSEDQGGGCEELVGSWAQQLCMTTASPSSQVGTEQTQVTS